MILFFIIPHHYSIHGVIQMVTVSTEFNATLLMVNNFNRCVGHRLFNGQRYRKEVSRDNNDHM